MAYYDFKIPENLNIDEIIKTNQMEFWGQGLKKEKLIYLINAVLISRAIHRKRDKDEKGIENNYAPLSSRMLETVVYNYDDYLKFMKNAGIIEINDSYVVGEYCKGYRFTKMYSGVPLKNIAVAKGKLYRGINKLNDKIKELQQTNNWGYGYLTKWWDEGKIKIDKDKACEWIENVYKNEKLNKISNAENYEEAHKNLIDTIADFKHLVEMIDEKKFHYSFSGEGNRFYNPLTNLKKELRNFITYNGKQLVSIDIKNSQPYFSTMLHNPKFWKKNEIFGIYRLGLDIKNKDVDYIYTIMFGKIPESQYSQGFTDSEFHAWFNSTAQKFIHDVLGADFYTFLQQHFIKNLPDFNKKFPERFESRQQIKKEVLRIFFVKPNEEKTEFYNAPCQEFSNLYPFTHKLFTGIKNIRHNLLPIILQKIESYCVIDIVCKRISKEYPHIPLFTIHDSIVTTTENMEIVKLIMEEEITKIVGIAPTLKPEYFIPLETINQWRPLIGYEGLYEINSNGEIRRLGKRYYQKHLRSRLDRAGYYSVKLNKNGINKTHFVHRLLAQNFIQSSIEGKEINHINGVKTDNRIENLEIVTHQQNVQHAYKTKLIKIPAYKCKKVIDNCSGKSYNSIHEASKALLIPYSTLKNKLSGKRTNSTCLTIAA